MAAMVGGAESRGGKRARASSYKGRPPGMCVLNVSISVEAREALEQLAPSGKSFGHYLSSLLLAEQARKGERQRLRTLLDQLDDTPP